MTGHIHQKEIDILIEHGGVMTVRDFERIMNLNKVFTPGVNVYDVILSLQNIGLVVCDSQLIYLIDEKIESRNPSKLEKLEQAMFDEIELIRQRHHKDVVRLIDEHSEHRFCPIGFGVFLIYMYVSKCIICGHIEVGC